VSLPGVHARGALGKILPPVMGSLLEHQIKGETRLRVYLSGDTLTGDHLDAVHYDDYKVMRSPLSAFRESARRADLDDEVRPVRRGETVNLI